ncbi:MAG: CAP domain-containing protein [Cognatishimia sp.]|nr:CAP domain-containing protein [Cognatishimia sp.]NQY39092.1 CAP domain-containing protein [Henriciella sp.]
MLQKYDKLKSSLLLAVAAAGGAAFSGAAVAAEAICSLENGYSIDLASYVDEASSCIDAADNIERSVADGLMAEINADRVSNGLAPLNRRGSLDKAALAHALDMSVRIYADHVDPEGRDHLHRIRAFDRTMLVGGSGANVTVSLANDDAQAVHAKVKMDAFNADNMMRASFTDVGIGVVEEAGQYYVVQVFAAAEGDLNEAVPISVAGTAPLKAKLSSDDQRMVAWGLVDTNSGEMLARSSMPRIRYSALDGADAAINVLVGLHNSTYVLKGPLVSGRN